MLVSGNGSQIAPSVALLDFSGCKFGFGVVMIATLVEQSDAEAPAGNGPLGPFGHRTGSRAVVKAARPPPVPASAGFGARKPSAYVPRSASDLTGVHFAPTFGVVELPEAPEEYESDRSAADSSTDFSPAASTSQYAAVPFRLPSFPDQSR